MEIIFFHYVIAQLLSTDYMMTIDKYEYIQNLDRRQNLALTLLHHLITCRA